VLIAIAILLLSETLGLWFVNNKLVIPPERMSATQWIYQASIGSFICSILVSPYMAAIIAHEDMNIYAYLSILEAIWKLGIVFILRSISIDKLQLYGILLCAISFINAVIYMIICKTKYQECKFQFYWHKDVFKEIASFIGWNLFSSIAFVAKNQGINVILNMFFGPVINAARGISLQLDGAVKSFSVNFMSAVRPQITKEYAVKNYYSMTSLIFRSAKLSYFLMLIFTVPLLFEMPYIIRLWLENPPAYSVIFISLTFIDTLFESISLPIMFVAQATGKLKLYMSVVCGSILFNMPISFVLLKVGFPPYTVMIVAIFITIIAFFLRLIIIRRLVVFPIRKFFNCVIVPVLWVSMFSVITPLIITKMFPESFIRLCCSVSINICLTLLFIYFIGLDKDERIGIRSYIHNKLNSKKQEED
jgi:O-antigen/teichoic acid export membrane protein